MAVPLKSCTVAAVTGSCHLCVEGALGRRGRGCFSCWSVLLALTLSGSKWQEPIREKLNNQDKCTDSRNHTEAMQLLRSSLSS